MSASLIYANHLINLVLQNANEKKVFKSADNQGETLPITSEQDDNDIFKAIKQAQDLSAKVHRR